MKEVHGNLLDMMDAGDFQVMIHGCNCHHSFGAGIAKQIKNRYPAAYAADLKTIKGSRTKLGTYSTATINNKFIVVNAYTQFYYGGGVRNADYDAIRKVFGGVKIAFSGSRIAYPKIGAGLAGGDWNIISAIIDEELDGEDHTLVIYE